MSWNDDIIEKIFFGFFVRLRTPQFLTYFKYVSILNYGFDAQMMNQWENVVELKCEFELELLCFTSGPAILKQNNINSVI